MDTSNKNSARVSYNREDIQFCLDCLNSMNVSGIEAMKRIVMIADKLMNPLPAAEEKGKEDPDGSRKEE